MEATLFLNAALERWLEAVRTMLAEHYADSPLSPLEVVAEPRKRYIRIMKGGSAYAFIDTRNGDVLKPDSHRGPAKGARGNIFRRAEGLGVGPYGAWVPSVGSRNFLLKGRPGGPFN